MLAFLPTVGFYYIQSGSLLIRSPSADMWRACVFIFPAKPHPVLQSVGLCGAPPALCPQTLSLIRLEPRLHALCLCRPLARRRRTRLLLIFHIPLSKPSICEEVGGVLRWRGGAAVALPAVNSCRDRLQRFYLHTSLCVRPVVGGLRRSVKQHCALCLHSAPFPV